MEKYSASPFQPRRSRLGPFGAAAFTAALLAGCASQPPVSTASPAEPPTAEETAVPAAAEPVAAPTGELSLREDAPLRYTVKAGDTLWGIAQHFLRDPWQWPELWFTNSQVRNPHQIRPGDVLTLVSVDGRMRLAFDGPSERLAPRIHEEALDSNLPAIPIEAIRNFLRGPRLVTLEETQRAPYIVAFVDERLAVGANNDVYVRNLGRDVAYNYAVIRVGEPYRDPETRSVLGYEAIPTGEAELREPGNAVGPTALMRVTKSSREVLIADRLLPIEAESFDANFHPHAPATPVNGRIISVFDGLTQISQYQIVALNRGSDHGLDPGTVLDILQAGRVVADPYDRKPIALPDQYAGVLMVFKVTPKLSYALVMNATRAIHVLDKVAKPAPSSLR
jgi:LysM repeat protein